MGRSFLLDRYRRFVDNALISEIYQLADFLKGLRIVHFNTTAEGGGVVEILQTLLPVMQELGIEHIWKVIQLDEFACQFTARLIHLMQGNEPGVISKQEQDTFLESLDRAFRNTDTVQADLYVIHDLQLAPLINLMPNHKNVIWFCHMDTANPNSNAAEYIKQFLYLYDLNLFNSSKSILKGLEKTNVATITLGIDAFSVKNKPMSREEGTKLLAQCGIDVTRPLITQVARFDKWKNPWHAIDAYRLVKKQIPTVQLALVGAMQATDDFEAESILKDIQYYSEKDPDIHLLHDPNMIGAKQVNAFQGYSDVIFQRSSREGFGFTVSEAMWKQKAVIGTSATGLSRQIIHNRTGYTVDTAEMCANHAVSLIQDHTLACTLGRYARAHVKSNFLLPMMIADYLKAILKLRVESS